MYDVTNLPDAVDIGFTGEKNFRKVEIDMSGWRIEGGTPAVVYLRPGETISYKPTVTYANGIMTWTVTDTDLGSIEGIGKMQIEMKKTGLAAKSPIVNVNVHNAIMR